MQDQRSRRTFIKGAGLAALGAALAGSEAVADGGFHRDNLIKAVKRAKIFDLSHTWDEKSPIAGVNPKYSMTLDPAKGAANHASTLGTFPDNNQLSFAGEVQQWSGQHGAPSIDAIGHIGHRGLLYGGVDAIASTSNLDGIGRSGVGAHLDIAHFDKGLLINHAVLLDVARFVNRSDTPLDPNFNVDGEVLADTARHQRVNLKRADTILVRTGWGQYFSGNPDLYMGEVAAGLSVNGAQYLLKQRPRIVGNDTLTFELRPPISAPPEVPEFQIFPVHLLVIAQNGVHIVENYDLEEIARAKEYEFLLVVAPLKIRGGTGSALRSFAIVG
jgi:kynurenine formamidase